MEKLDIATIARRSAHGVLAQILRQFFLSFVSFAASLVIFTYLTPKEVGIYTGVTAIQRIISFFTDFGFGAALVQKKGEPTQKEISTSFTFQALLTIVIFLAVFIFRGYIASFFSLSEAAIRLLLVLVFSIFLSSFKIIPSIILEREIKFQKLIIPQIAESLIYNLFLVVLILNNFRLDSYSLAILASSIIGIPFYYYASPWKFSISIDRDSLQHLKYGARFQAKNILATIKDDLLTVFLVKFISFAEIGFIGFAQKIAFFAFRYIVDSTTKVTFSTYSRIQDKTTYLKKAIEKSLFFVSATIFPILLGIIVTAPYILIYFPKWHNKWEPALLSLTFFCLNGIVSSLSNILVNVLDSTGRVKITLNLMIQWTILTWVLTPILLYFFGYNGVSIASFLVTITIVSTIYLVKKIVDFDFFRSIYKPLICSVVLTILIYISERMFVKNFTSLLIIVLAGGLFYVACLYLLAKKALTDDIKFFFAKL